MSFDLINKLGNAGNAVGGITVLLGLIGAGLYVFVPSKKDFEELKNQVSTIEKRMDALQKRVDKIEANYISKEDINNTLNRANQGSQASPNARPPSQNEGNSVPLGLIGAFRSSCPLNWTPYEPANGKFLLGTGSLNDQKLPSEGVSAFDMIGATDVPSVFQRGDGNRIPLYKLNTQAIWYGDNSIAYLPPYTKVKFCIRGS